MVKYFSTRFMAALSDALTYSFGGDGTGVVVDVGRGRSLLSGQLIVARLMVESCGATSVQSLHST